MHTNPTTNSEVAILACIPGKDQDQLPGEMARYLPTLGFSDRDKGRMHTVAVRNQEDNFAHAYRGWTDAGRPGREQRHGTLRILTAVSLDDTIEGRDES